MIHSEYDSAESIADSDLEDGERKMQASPQNVHGRRKKRASSPSLAPPRKPDARNTQKRETSAHCTKSDHSRRESLKSNSPQEPQASGKPDTVFSSRNDELGNQFENSVQNWEDLFLKVIKITRSVKQDLNL